MQNTKEKLLSIPDIASILDIDKQFIVQLSYKYSLDFIKHIVIVQRIIKSGKLKGQIEEDCFYKQSILTLINNIKKKELLEYDKTKYFFWLKFPRVPRQQGIKDAVWLYMKDKKIENILSEKELKIYYKIKAKKKNEINNKK